MRVRGLILGCIVICVAALAVPRAHSDEIRLKDGQKLYGVIVAYEDNMFKVKTDFGFVLVEKDKIAAIIPASPGTHPTAKPETQPAKSPSPAPVKPSASKPATPVTTAHKEVPAPATPAPAPVKSVAPPPTANNDPKPPKVATAEAPKTGPALAPAATPAPAMPSSAPKPLPEKKSPPPSTTPAAETASAAKPPAASNVPVVTPIPAKAKVIELPPNREAVQGNLYINYSHGFRMYKAPSWKLIEDAPQALPNAIVAMGTANESTLMVVGQEKTKSSLEATAADVEKRLRDTYGNYRRISLNKTVAGGFPAIEIKYRGLAEDHDWSGTLLVVARSGDMFSVLGMTYSDTDLIQIQENVIGRAIASLEFNSN
jgi:hypothetical protein